MNKVTQRLQENVRARVALTWLATPDEESCLPVVQHAAEEIGYVVFAWDCVHGFTCLSKKEIRHPPNDGMTNVERALEVPATYSQERGLFVYRDFDLLVERLQQPPAYVTLVRRLKDLSRTLKTGVNAVVLLASSPAVPRELESFVSLLEDPYPRAEELESLTDSWLAENGLTGRCELDKKGKYRLARAATGMTASQFQSALARSVIRRKALCSLSIDDVLEDKVEIIRKTEVLELVQWEEGMEDVGGYGNLKEWLRKRATAGSPAAESYGLPPELLRPGRFDQVFFLDLPTADERREITKVLMRKYGRDPEGLVTDELITKLDRFTGADIEAVIVEALYKAFEDGVRPLCKEDLLLACVKVTPIADRMRDEIEDLRRWGKNHARPAS